MSLYETGSDEVFGFRDPESVQIQGFGFSDKGLICNFHEVDFSIFNFV